MVGAIPGALPVMIGVIAFEGVMTTQALFLFAIQFLWQFPHFFAIAWMYKDQYAKAGILMLPVIDPSGRVTARQIVLFSIMMVPISLAPFFLGFAGWIFLSAATALGVWFLVESVRTARAKTPEMARRLLLVSVLYLPIMFALLVLDKR